MALCGLSCLVLLIVFLIVLLQISHSIAKHEKSSDWVVLTEEEKAAIKPSEDVDPIENDSCWTCNHCTVHLDRWESRRNVVDHLKTVYVLESPHTSVLLTLYAVTAL
jgi:hypothetical protein